MALCSTPLSMTQSARARSGVGLATTSVPLPVQRRPAGSSNRSSCSTRTGPSSTLPTLSAQLRRCLPIVLSVTIVELAVTVGQKEPHARCSASRNGSRTRALTMARSALSNSISMSLSTGIAPTLLPADAFSGSIAARPPVSAPTSMPIVPR